MFSSKRHKVDDRNKDKYNFHIIHYGKKYRDIDTLFFEGKYLNGMKSMVQCSLTV